MSEDSSDGNQKWLSACQLSKYHIGGHASIGQKLRRLRAELVCEIMEQAGYPANEAIGVVSDNLVGWQKSLGGKSAKVLRASPEAVRLLAIARKDDFPGEDEASRKVGPSPSVPKIEWKSANQLRLEYRGSHAAITQKLTKFQEILINDIISQYGICESMASFVIENNLIGVPDEIPGSIKTGPKTLHASAEAVLLMEKEGILQRKTKSRSMESDRDHPHRNKDGRSR